MAEGKKPRKKKRPTKRLLFAGGLGVLWLAALVLVAVPAFNSALRNHREVRDLEAQLADLDTWTVAGMWLQPEVERRAQALDSAWQEAFPGRRGREELFLDIARAADASGLLDFDLRELRLPEDERTPPPLQTALEAHLGASGNVAGVPLEIPRIDLRTYRLKSSFLADYAGMSRFLGRLQRLQRAMTVHNLEIVPEKGRIRVALELDVYVSQTS